MNKEMKTAEEILHAAYKILEEKQDSSSDTVDPILIAAMEEYAEQLKSPAISSNEGETVEQAVQKVLDYLHENITASIVYEDFYDFSKGIKGAEVDYFPESTQELIAEMGAKWQSQHSYTEADLKAAWQAGNDFGNECHCGECDYCIDVKYGEAQPFDVWVKTYPKKITPIYSTDEVLAIIEQVKEKVTEAFMSDKSITDIDFKYLLK